MQNRTRSEPNYDNVAVVVAVIVVVMVVAAADGNKHC
jgi:hypothetical protein